MELVYVARGDDCTEEMAGCDSSIYTVEYSYKSLYS